MSAIDKAIAAISPGWAARRAEARARLARSEAMSRGYNAATKGRRLGDGWSKVDSESPTASHDEISSLRARAREMSRNNPYWKSARGAIVAQVVGHGIRATVGHPNKREAARIQADFDAWAKSSDVDAAGKLDWYAIQSLAMRSVVEAGEVLVRRVLGDDSQLRLQVIGAEHFDASKDGMLANGGEIVGGVEVDSYGKPVAYHLHKRHPRHGSGETVRVPASEIAHVYFSEYPGQQRGVSWISTVFTRLVDWDEFEDADLMRQKVAACFGAFYSGNIDRDDETELHEKLEPGMIEFLPPGVEVKFPTPPASGGIRDSASICHHAIASGLGITYEDLTGDYSNVNFSSARMAHLRMARNVREWQQTIMIDLLCERVFAWFLEARALRRGMNGAELSQASVEWTCPSREMIDPEKETRANTARVRSGFSPWSEVVRETGKDPEVVMEQIARDQRRFDELGLVLDVDPRKVSNQGQGSVNQKQDGVGDGEAKPSA